VEEWPVADESKINPELERQEMMSEKLIEDINNIKNLIKEKQNKEVKDVYVYTLPNEKELYDKKFIKEKLNLNVEIFSVSDNSKYDPQGKAGKAKPGKPAIYLE
jgi:valyl-tRNA synthetase